MTLVDDFASQDALNRTHSEVPQVGDYWDEMFMPIALVVMVDDNWVAIQRDFKRGRFTPGVDPKPHVMSRGAFTKWLRYETIPDKTWASVSPAKFADHLQLREAAQ